MNRFTFVATRTAAVVSLSVACALPALAQTTATTGGTSSGPTVESREVDDGQRDYGWIGLLGLVGLLGLRRKRDDRDMHVHTDTRRTTTSH